VTGTGPSWHLSSVGTRAQLREYVAHRSVYHLMEADPQAWVVPRLEGQAKAAVVTVQHDEYGAGRVERMHARLFAETMVEFGLRTEPGAYLDLVPAATLAPVNLMSLLGLHRALRGAAFGQFAMIEVTSSPGSRRLSSAFARLAAGAAGQRFYDEHVEADAVHEQVLRAGVRDLLRREPHLAADSCSASRRGCCWRTASARRCSTHGRRAGARCVVRCRRASPRPGPGRCPRRRPGGPVAGGWCRRTAAGGCGDRCTARRRAGRSAPGCRRAARPRPGPRRARARRAPGSRGARPPARR
jgi:hypothetical protein